MSEYEGIFIAFASTSDSEKERLELEFIVFFLGYTFGYYFIFKSKVAKYIKIKN